MGLPSCRPFVTSSRSSRSDITWYTPFFHFLRSVPTLLPPVIVPPVLPLAFPVPPPVIVVVASSSPSRLSCSLSLHPLSRSLCLPLSLPQSPSSFSPSSISPVCISLSPSRSPALSALPTGIIHSIIPRSVAFISAFPPPSSLVLSSALLFFSLSPSSSSSSPSSMFLSAPASRSLPPVFSLSPPP